MTTNTTVHGLYTNRGGLEEAVAALRVIGFRDDDISVMGPNVQESKDQEQHTRTLDGAVSGGENGALVGGALGGLTGLGLIVVPVVGPFIALGSMLTGMGVGGTVGSIVGALVGLGVPENEAKRYEGRIEEGNMLLFVRCETSERVDRAKELLRHTGASEVSLIPERFLQEQSV